LEEFCHQQREDLEIKTQLQSHHCDENVDFHEFNDYEERDTDNTDFDYITAILGSFTDKKNMRLYEEEEIFYNSNLGEFYKDTSFRACQKHQTMPSKFNYKLIIKTSAPQKFSCGSTLDEETEDHWDKSDNKNEEFENTETPTISSITESRRSSPFATWCPFIPNNSHKNFLQDSPTQLSSRPSSAPRSSSPELSHKAEAAEYPYMKTGAWKFLQSPIHN
jgi:hypothetical protein